MNPRLALLIVDVQTGFDHPSWGRRNNPSAEDNISVLLARWRETESPIFHVRHISTEPDSPLKNAGTEFKAMVDPHAGETVIEKSVNSAFIGTDLEARLRESDIESLVVVGLTTDHCVSTTVRMAANLGFNVRLASDATATFERTGPDGEHHTAEAVHQMALVHLHEEFAGILTTQKLLEDFN